MADCVHRVQWHLSRYRSWINLKCLLTWKQVLLVDNLFIVRTFISWNTFQFNSIQYTSSKKKNRIKLRYLTHRESSDPAVTSIRAGKLRNFSWIPSKNKRIFTSLKCPDLLGLPPSFLLSGKRGHFPHPLILKNVWRYTYFPPYVFMVCTVTP